MYQRFVAVAKQHPDLIAVSNEQHQATYSELLEQVESLRPLLRKENRSGDNRCHTVVLIALPGGPHFTAAQLVCFSEQAIAAPVPNKSTTHETTHYLGLVRPDLVIVESLDDARPLIKALDHPTTILCLEETGHQCPPHRIITWSDVMKARPGTIEPVMPQKTEFPPDITLIQFTSGSTGIPKGILLSRGNLKAYLENNQAFLSAFSGKHVFCPMPQFHAFGNTVVLEHLLNSSSVHLTNRFVPGEDLGRMKQYNCSSLLCAPNYARLLLDLNALKQKELPSLSSISMGTATVDQGLVHDLYEQFQGLQIYLRYGLTETMGPITRLILADGKELTNPGLVGPTVPGVELAEGLPLPDNGEPAEVRVMSKVIAVGQLLERDCWQPLVDEDGFFSTGDLGCLDEEGHLYLRGRFSTFIKRNGFRINPFEIEELLRGVYGIQEAVVVGIPDKLSGEKIIACIEAASKTKAPQPQDLLKVCRDNLSAYKIPQRIMVMDALPRMPSGKPDRTKISISLSA